MQPSKTLQILIRLKMEAMKIDGLKVLDIHEHLVQSQQVYRLLRSGTNQILVSSNQNRKVVFHNPICRARERKRWPLKMIDIERNTPFVSDGNQRWVSVCLAQRTRCQIASEKEHRTNHNRDQLRKWDQGSPCSNNLFQIDQTQETLGLRVYQHLTSKTRLFSYKMTCMQIESEVSILYKPRILSRKTSSIMFGKNYKI